MSRSYADAHESTDRTPRRRQCDFEGCVETATKHPTRSVKDGPLSIADEPWTFVCPAGHDVQAVALYV